MSDTLIAKYINLSHNNITEAVLSSLRNETSRNIKLQYL